jgi:chitin disaccharide deacetylase
VTVTLHADDLGLHPAVDRAVFRAFEAGAITGASILATGETFKSAAEQARSLGLPLSLHLSVVDTGALSAPSEIPSLVGQHGQFLPTFTAVARRALFGGLRPDELRLEIGRQLAAFADAGLVGDNGLQVDGHQHLHLLPAVFSALLDRGREFGLTRFRLPRLSQDERGERSVRRAGFMVAEVLGRRALARACTAGVQPVSCWGVLYAGRLTEDHARNVLASLPQEAAGELICHPGDDDRALGAAHKWGYAWETELRTILALAERQS